MHMSTITKVWLNRRKTINKKICKKKIKEANRATYCAPEYNVPPFWRIWQSCHFCLLIDLKVTNLVEDVEILLSVKLLWILFSSFRGKVENVSANQRPGWPSFFSRLGWPSFFSYQKNINLVKDIEILLPVKFRWILFSGFRGEVENVSANQRPGRPSCFPISPKNTNLVEDNEILLPVKFCYILFCGFRGEVENLSANQRPGHPSLFFWSARKAQTW